MKIIAHRGNDGIHKENTMEGLLNSLTMDYIDGIEFDIRITKDFQFVINHDPFYAGYLIKNTTLRKLQKKGLNSLDEVLKKISSDKIIMIEIKEESNRFHILTAKLYRLLKKYNLNYHVVSFNYKLMKYFRKKHPDIKNGLLIGKKLNNDHIDNEFDFNSINYRHINKANNKETYIWTVDTEEIYKKVKPNQNIITDNAKYMSELSK